MKLYYSRNLNPRLCVAAARYMKAPVEFTYAEPFHPDHQAFFKALNPNNLVPILVDGDAILWETDAIVCKLAQVTGSTFWPAVDRLPELMRWLSWAAYHFVPPGGEFYFERIVRPTFSSEEAAPAVMENHMANFRRHAGTLNGLLAGRRWLIDDALSYADFRVGAVMPFAERAGLPIADYPEIMRWKEQLDAIDAWRDPFEGLDMPA